MVAHDRLIEPRVTMKWLLVKPRSFANLHAFLDSNGNLKNTENWVREFQSIRALFSIICFNALFGKMIASLKNWPIKKFRLGNYWLENIKLRALSWDKFEFFGQDWPNLENETYFWWIYSRSTVAKTVIVWAVSMKCREKSRDQRKDQRILPTRRPMKGSIPETSRQKPQTPRKNEEDLRDLSLVARWSIPENFLKNI